MSVKMALTAKKTASCVFQLIQVLDTASIKNWSFVPILHGGGGCLAPPLRFFVHNSEREKDNSTKFGDFY